MNLLRVTQKTKLYNTFVKYPEVIFSPATVGLTCKVPTYSCRRICGVLLKEDKIMKVRRGFYKLKPISS